MTWLLDTVTISELRKAQRTHPSVAAWYLSVPVDTCWLSVITITEIHLGALRVKKRDPVFSSRLEAWCRNSVIPAFEGRIIPIDLAVASLTAEYRDIGLSGNDSLIAATARVHGLTLATRNTSDFTETGISLVNPWEFGK
jgi:hypothetical protein